MNDLRIAPKMLAFGFIDETRRIIEDVQLYDVEYIKG